MSNRTQLTAYIQEFYPYHQENCEFYRNANDETLRMLPLEDEFPPLSRSMVGCSGSAFSQGGSGRERLIYVGAYLNHVLDRLPVWLDKFEGLLNRLYWMEAEVHVRGGWMCAQYFINYRIDSAQVARYLTEPRKPLREWTLQVWDVNAVPSNDSRLPVFLGQERFQVATRERATTAEEIGAHQPATRPGSKSE